MHKVTCPYCKQQFDRDTALDILQISVRRWAHVKCHEQAQSSERLVTNQDLEMLKTYINELFKDFEIDWGTIMREIKTCVDKRGWSYSGIQKTLIYCYEVKKMDKAKANGHIGIVYKMYPEALQYYKSIFMREKLAEQQFEQLQPKVVKTSPQVPHRKIKLFDMED